MTDNLDTILKDKLIELADQEFPKGDKGRGQAMVLIALCLQEVEQLIREQRAEELEWALQSSGGGEWRRRIIVRLAQLDAEGKKKALTDLNKEEDNA